MSKAARVSLTFLFGLVLAYYLLLNNPSEILNYGNCKKVLEGMTVLEVVEIMGQPDNISRWPEEPHRISYNYNRYEWNASSSISISFRVPNYDEARLYDDADFRTKFMFCEDYG